MDEQKVFEGKTVRDLLIDVVTDVKLIRQTLEGSPGHEGICQQVASHEKQLDDQDTILTKHTVYFTLIGAAITTIIALVLWGIEKI